ncbi:MAG: phosphoserine phosphatase [Gemmatimonadaceae bacterium]|nr:phosphoserine phosphatase [Gemmatimonadaceae bacterium]
MSGVEGIDWLASQRGAEVEAWSGSLTARAMEGLIPIESVYGERMAIVKPTRSEIKELSAIYIDRVAPGARETLAELREHGVELVLVSGGLREAILPLAKKLGIRDERVHAVSVFFGSDGEYTGFDERSLMTRQNGKRAAVKEMALKGPVLAVGDGMTDCEIRPVVDGFAAFTGFMKRDPVVERADYVIENFDQLRALVLE